MTGCPGCGAARGEDVCCDACWARLPVLLPIGPRGPGAIDGKRLSWRRRLVAARQIRDWGRVEKIAGAIREWLRDHPVPAPAPADPIVAKVVERMYADEPDPFAAPVSDLDAIRARDQGYPWGEPKSGAAADRRTLLARVDAVLALHVQGQWGECAGCRAKCLYCQGDHPFPCAVRLALDPVALATCPSEAWARCAQGGTCACEQRRREPLAPKPEGG